MSVLPYLAIGGLLYLMAKNASTLKSSATTTAIAPPAGSPANNCGVNDFGVTGSTSCWCG